MSAYKYFLINFESIFLNWICSHLQGKGWGFTRTYSGGSYGKTCPQSLDQIQFLKQVFLFRIEEGVTSSETE